MERRDLLKMIAAATGVAFVGAEAWAAGGVSSAASEASVDFSAKDVQLLDEIAARDWPTLPRELTHGAISAAVAVGFIRFTLPDVIDLTPFPALTAHADRCEQTAAFRHWPVDRETP